MSAKERTVIDQALCRQVELLLRGGASGQEAARITKTSSGTISRITAAGIDVNVFRMNTERRRIAEKNQREDTTIRSLIQEYAEKQDPEKMAERDRKVLEQVKRQDEVEGQIRMELPEEISDQTKFMRFQAAQVEKVLRKLETINDTLNMIIRVIRKE